MKHARLDLARSAELLPPLEGSIAVFGQINIGRLQGLNFSTLRAVSDSYITNQNLKSVDIQVSRSLSETSGSRALQSRSTTMLRVSQAIPKATVKRFGFVRRALLSCLIMTLVLRQTRMGSLRLRVFFLPMGLILLRPV